MLRADNNSTQNPNNYKLQVIIVIMLTFADQAEIKAFQNPTKYISSTFEDNKTKFNYHTTPSHPTENKNPNERLLDLKFEAKSSEKTIEKLLSFLSTSQISLSKSSHIDIYTRGDNYNYLTISQFYVPEFDMYDYNLKLEMSRESRKEREETKYQELSSWISKTMEDFYGIKIKLDYTNHSLLLRKTGTSKSEGVVGISLASYGGNKLDEVTAHIFQSPVVLKTRDMVKTLLDPQGISSHPLSKTIYLLTSSNNEGIHLKKEGPIFEFNFHTDFVDTETRKKYANKLFDIYREITNTSPKLEFKLQNAFIDIK